MGKWTCKENRNIRVIISDYYLNNMNIVSKYKDEATSLELKELELLLTALKQIPIESAKLLYVRYFKRSKIRESKDKVVKSTKSHVPVTERYVCRSPSQTKIAKELGITYVKYSELENNAFESLADKLLEIKLDGMKLSKAEIDSYQISADDSAINKLHKEMEQWQIRLEASSYELELLYKDPVNNKNNYKVIFYQEVWKKSHNKGVI